MPTTSADAQAAGDDGRRSGTAATAVDGGIDDHELAALLAAATTHLQADRLAQAERALTEVLRRSPDQPDALHFLGVLRHAQGHHGEALELIGRALDQLPRHAGAWNNLGNVLLGIERYDDAERAYGYAIDAAAGATESALTLTNLGTLHRLRGRRGEAEAACRQALAIDEHHAPAWYNLSRVLLEQGRIHEGLLANSRAVTLLPRQLQARDQVIRALVLLGEREHAAQLYREWLAEEPDNPVVQHQLAACVGDAPPPRASDAYVQQVFDSFAASFDAKLEKLAYRAPELVTQALVEAAGEPDRQLDIVDAGCGTGLCGPLLRPHAKRLAGCDLSRGMLRHARERRVYDVLHQAELVYYLDTQPAAFDAVVSADTLCYFGALDAAFAAAHRAVRPGGWLVFTVEALDDADDADHRLQPSGRYAHGLGYLRRSLLDAGWALLAAHRDTLRSEAGRPVAGWVVSARRETA